VLLVPIHVAMLSGITATFGAPLDRGFITTTVGSILGSGGAAFGGRLLAASLVELLKLVPGLNVGAMVISGTTAAFLTIALGLSYLEVIVKLTRENLLGLDPCRIQEMVIQGTK